MAVPWAVANKILSEVLPFGSKALEDKPLLLSDDTVAKPVGCTFLRSWLGHYATSRKVAGSIPDEVIGIFNWPNPSRLTWPRGRLGL
jgi:hypothetical protein